MVQTNPNGRTDAHWTKIVTTMSRLPANGLDKNLDLSYKMDLDFWNCLGL